MVCVFNRDYGMLWTARFLYELYYLSAYFLFVINWKGHFLQDSYRKIYFVRRISLLTRIWY